jgi:hypothetical protein
MGRLVGCTLGIACAFAITAAPAVAQTGVSIGVFTPNIGAHVVVGRPVYPRPVYAPVYYPPVYQVPVYRERVYYPAYNYPVYEPYYRPVYRDRVIIVRHDNGRHNGWYKKGRGPGWRDDRSYYRDDRHYRGGRYHRDGD